MSHSGNAGQRFTSKTHRSKRPKILVGPKFTRRVSLKRAYGIRAAHPLPIIGHPNEGEAAVLHINRDGLTLRIDAVFEKLLHNRCRAFDDFPRCDATDDFFR
jgi:hypothetical protein